MTDCRRCFPEHDLMVHLIWGDHDAEEALQFARGLDETCATRWLCYFHPSVDMAGLDIAHIPAVRRAVEEKRKELFGDTPKPFALVSPPRGAEQDFEFWRRYEGGGGSAFHSLEAAYDWLGLSEAARAAASATLQSWEPAAPSTGVAAGREPAQTPPP